MNTMCNQCGSIWPFLDFQLAVRYFDVIAFRISMPWLLLLLAFCVPAVWAEVLEGRVVSVADGDTITLLDGNRQQHKIRLAGIDAPEMGQAFGKASKANLSRLIYRNQVEVEWHKTDKYKRLVGKVVIDGTDVCLEQIKAGLAWHYKKYEREQPPRDRMSYAQAETQARKARLGLWADKQPVAPWEWRARSQVKGDATTSSLSAPQPMPDDPGKPRIGVPLISPPTISKPQGLPKGGKYDDGCGSRGGPGWRKANGQCASWAETP